ncbi:MAG TPA: NB-ARC domain-containing protein, partial [Thermomicrobiales bacterium]|nr:NB-ARC domain-containing protein [Thermomicrobiales bacterium]
MNSVEHPRQPPVTMVNLAVRDLSSPVHLPRPLTPFVGRVAEVAAIVARLRTPGVRLLNLIGPGGIGKTRLAIAVAGELAEDYPDGIHYVRLVAATDPVHVPLAIAQSLELRETGRDLESRIADVIGYRRTLIVLDNFEQVVEAAPFVASLLGACHNLTILVTSRVRLQVTGENEYRVRPLHLPRLDQTSPPTIEELTSTDAVALFLDRARSTAAILDDDDIRVVSEICDHLEGIPLGIELAAARLRVLSPRLVLDRLRHQLEFLTGGESDRPAHQRTMRDTVAWSYDLLPPAEQSAF